MKTFKSYPLNAMAPSQFETMCLELLAAEYPDLSVSPAEAPRWLSAVGVRKTEQGIRSVAVEVKYLTSIPLDTWRLFAGQVERNGSQFQEYIFVTSSVIPQETIQKIELLTARKLNAEVRLLDGKNVAALLGRLPEIDAKYFKAIRNRDRWIKIAGGASFIFIAVGFASFAMSIYQAVRPRPDDSGALSAQVKNVEDSLSKLNGIEAGLHQLKEELQQKTDESARVRKEYEAAMQLKTLTNEQLLEVHKAVATQSGREVFMNYFWGFLIGVAASILANIFTAEWNKRRRNSATEGE